MLIVNLPSHVESVGVYTMVFLESELFLNSLEIWIFSITGIISFAYQCCIIPEDQGIADLKTVFLDLGRNQAPAAGVQWADFRPQEKE